MSNGRKSTSEMVEVATNGLRSMDSPPKINRTSYEYKLAAYYYALYENEKNDHQITKQELIRADGVLTEYSNAYHGMDRKRLESQKIADQQVISEYAAASEMEDVFKDHKSKINFKITAITAGLILGLVFIWQLSANADFRMFFSANMWAFVATALGAVAIMYLLGHGRKR